MKILHYINSFFYFITIGLYASIYLIILGAYAQIILGIVQLLIAIILLFYYQELSRKLQKMYLLYWLMAITILVLVYGKLVLYFKMSNTTELIILFIIPMLIATYFVYLTFLIRKYLKK